MKPLRSLLARIRLTLAAWAFLRRWHRLTHGAWPVPPQSEAQWLPAQAAALAAFLHTPGGAALIAHLREKDVLVTTNAVHGSPDRREYRCGYAAGFRDTVAYLVTLSTPPVAHAGTEPSAEGAADLLARLAP